MPRDGTTGVFTRVANSFSNPSSGVTIDPTDADTYMDDVDTGLTFNNTNPLTLIGSISGVIKVQAAATASGTITVPAATDTLVALNTTDALTNKTLGNTNTVTLKDTLFTLQDDGDITKQAKWQLSGITTATTRTYTLPDVSDTLATLAATQELTNKTLNAAVGKGTWTASGTWTLPALTLGGAITYGGVTLSNAVTGTGSMVLSAGPTLSGAVNLSGLTLSTALALDASKNIVSVANTGSGSNVLASAPTLVSPILGSATASSLTLSTTSGIIGTTTNDSAAAGSVGQLLESTVVSGSSVALTTNTAKDVTTISLTAGDWDVRGVVYFIATNASTSITQTIGYLSDSATNTLDVTPGRHAFHIFNAIVPGAVSFAGEGIPSIRVSVSLTTTFRLGAFATFTVSTLGAYGYISARRVR